jgi:O-antigen ligase
MDQGALFVYAAYANLILGVAFIDSPLVVAALFIFFRVTFQAAAWTKATVLGMPYSVPAIALAAAAMIYSLTKGRKIWPLSGVFKIYLCFLYVVIFAAIADLETGVATIEMAAKIISPVIIYFLVLQGIQKESDIDRALRLLMYTSLVPMAVGVWQFVTGSTFFYDEEEMAMTSLESTRVSSTVIDANNYGVYISFILFSMLPFVVKKLSIKTVVLILLIIFSLITSQNRGTWIALFVALTVSIVVFRRRLRILYWAAAGGGTVLASLPIILTRFSELHQLDEWGQSQDTLGGRLGYHAELLNRSFDHPILGAGLGASLWSETSPGYLNMEYPHNDYMRILVDSGYPALLLYVTFFVIQYIRTVRYRSSRRWDIQFAAHAAIIYVIIISFVQNLYSELVVYPVFMYLLAVFHRATAFEAPKPKREPIGLLAARQCELGSLQVERASSGQRPAKPS